MRWCGYISLWQTSSSPANGHIFLEIGVVRPSPWCLCDSQNWLLFTTWTVSIFGLEEFSHWIIPTTTCVHRSLASCCLTQTWVSNFMATSRVTDCKRPTHLRANGCCQKDISNLIFQLEIRLEFFGLCLDDLNEFEVDFLTTISQSHVCEVFVRRGWVIFRIPM